MDATLNRCPFPQGHKRHPQGLPVQYGQARRQPPRRKGGFGGARQWAVGLEMWAPKAKPLRVGQTRPAPTATECASGSSSRACARGGSSDCKLPSDRRRPRVRSLPLHRLHRPSSQERPCPKAANLKGSDSSLSPSAWGTVRLWRPCGRPLTCPPTPRARTMTAIQLLPDLALPEGSAASHGTTGASSARVGRGGLPSPLPHLLSPPPILPCLPLSLRPGSHRRAKDQSPIKPKGPLSPKARPAVAVASLVLTTTSRTRLHPETAAVASCGRPV